MASKSYHRKKSKENYQLNKKLSKEYQQNFGSNIGKSFTEFKKQRKKDLG